MLKKLYPDIYVSSLKDINPQKLMEKGIKGLILDLDNTITPWRAGVLQPEMIAVLNRFREAGLKICVVSNALSNRVKCLFEPLGIPGLRRAGKPSRKPFKKAMRILETEPSETAVAGDQVFTDILGGNRLGLYTILVVPISKKEFIGTKLVRIVERLLLKKLAKKGIVKLKR